MKNLLLVLSITLCFSVKAQSWYRNTALDTASKSVNVGYTNVKAISVAYTSTVTVYLKFYNSGSKVYNSTSPVLTIPINSPTTAKTAMLFLNTNLTFSSGLYIKCTTGITDTSTVIPATKPIVEIQY